MWQHFLDSAWFIFFFPLLLFLSVAGGILFAVQYKKNKKWEPSGIENSILAIFGLIISFTFLIAGNAHRERYGYIHMEANASEALYRYSKELPGSFASQTRSSLLNFLENQLNYNKRSGKDENYYLTNAVKISDQYWAYLSDYKRKNTDASLTGLLDKIAGCFDNIKSSFTLHVYSYYERTPTLVMVLLILSALLIGFLVGFMNGIKPAIHYLVPVIYFVMITFIMIVIRDLNNPLKGFIQPDFYDLTNIYERVKEGR